MFLFVLKWQETGLLYNLQICFPGNYLGSFYWLSLLDVLFVVVELVITSGNWWCASLHIFNCWHGPVPCAGWRPGGPGSTHRWALGTEHRAGGSRRWAASWDTMVEGQPGPKSGQVVAISGAWGDLAPTFSRLCAPRWWTAVMNATSSYCPSACLCIALISTLVLFPFLIFLLQNHFTCFSIETIYWTHSKVIGYDELFTCGRPIWVFQWQIPMWHCFFFYLPFDKIQKL